MSRPYCYLLTHLFSLVILLAIYCCFALLNFHFVPFGTCIPILSDCGPYALLCTLLISSLVLLYIRLIFDLFCQWEHCCVLVLSPVLLLHFLIIIASLFISLSKYSRCATYSSVALLPILKGWNKLKHLLSDSFILLTLGWGVGLEEESLWVISRSPRPIC